MLARMKRLSIVAVAWAAIALAPEPALAWLRPGPTTQYPPEGGVWQYGFWNFLVRSYYYHPTACHGSTADFWNGSEWRRVRSLNTQPGYTSVAEIGGYNLWYTDDRYWYRIVNPGYCRV